MLEHVPAANEIASVMGMLLAVEFLKILNPTGGCALRPRSFVARVEANSAILAGVAQQRKKMPFSASNLNHVLVPNSVRFDQPIRELARILLEHARKIQRVVISHRIFQPAWV